MTPGKLCERMHKQNDVSNMGLNDFKVFIYNQSGINFSHHKAEFIIASTI